MARRQPVQGVGQILRQFDVAFALMSVIPLLVCGYLIAAKFFTLQILLGVNGVYFLLAVACALLGLLYGRAAIMGVIRRLVEGNRTFESMSAELKRLNERLTLQLVERGRVQVELSRLASFPEASPNPIVELDDFGTVTYCNPVARAKFHDLDTRAAAHPIAQALSSAIRELAGGAEHVTVLETAVGDRVYEQHIAYLPASRRVRSYVIDVTEHKRAQAALAKEKHAVERANQVMIGREERILELKQDVNALLKELGRPARYDA